MSIAAARSPSPGPPARPCCGGLRRSADSSPFRPAASPPDSPQRSAVCKHGGRASPRPWGAEKENDPRERDAAGSARAQKVRSSAGACGGGSGVCVTKSFMAPTISAASKAVAPSPRKKVLGERNNDPVPVPSSPLDLAHGGSSKPRGPHPQPPEEAALGAPRRLRLSLDGASALPPPPAGGRSFGGDDAASVMVEIEDPVSVDNHHAAASADAEAVAAAPYDPKTNYLSPRPRFLRYQPNRHLQIYRHGGGCVRGLEDMFASESSSEENTTTEEEEVSVEEQPVDSSEEETSALASASEARAQSAAPALDGLLLPQPALDSPVLTPEEESPQAGGVLIPEQEPAVSPAPARPKKKRSPLLAPLALLLLMTVALVCVPPGHPASEFLSVQELHPVELAARLKQWSSSSLDFVTSYWEAIASYQERDVFGTLLATNLSAAAAAADVDADYAAFYYSADVEEELPSAMEEMIARLDVEDGLPGAMEEMIARLDVEDGLPGAMEEVNVDAAVEEFNVEMAEEVSTAEMAEEVSTAEMAEEVSTAEMAEEVSGSSGEEMAAFIQNSDIPSQSTPEPEQAEGDHADGKEDQEEVSLQHGQKLGSDMWPSYLDKISNPAAIGSALAAIIVAAAVAFYTRKKQTRVASNEPAEQIEQVEQVEHVEQVEQVGSLSGSGSSQGHVVAKGSLFQSSGIEETERLGGSGPSQYSSSLSSGLGRRRNTKVEEDAGVEPVASRTRRDSTAQSTSSYGSFTTYQKIPAKKGNKEDEAMTPVRRSSRLRNVKTPEA